MEVKPNAFTIPKQSVMSKEKPPRLSPQPGHYWKTLPIVNQKQSQILRDGLFKMKKADI